MTEQNPAVPPSGEPVPTEPLPNEPFGVEPPPPGPAPLPTTAPYRQAPARPRSGSAVAWFVSLILAALVGALLFVGGYLAAGGQGSATCAAPNDAFEAFCEAYDKLKEQFVDQLDDEQLAEGAIQGMFEYGVRDPFSGYMSPEDYQRALGDLSGRFSGIGAEMGVQNLEEPADLEACAQLSDTCVLVVISPLPDSPAQEAGLEPGDVVLAVDGESVDGSTLEAQVARVRGDAGTDVTLSLRRDEETFDLTITRAEIEVREVTSRMLEDQIGYVALHGFSDNSADQFREAIGDLLDQGATSFVFDLRDNPGGYIEAARKVASEFIADGVIFTQESAGDEETTWEATGDGLATDPHLPVVVLVNNGSASASEIVAAALQDRERATVVGQHSYGKNTVQVWAPLDNGGGVRITISRWFTPDHRSVAPDGVQPDVAVEVPDGTPPDRDLYLERAVEVITDLARGAAQVESPLGSAQAERPVWQDLAALLLGYDPAGQRAAAA